MLLFSWLATPSPRELVCDAIPASKRVLLSGEWAGVAAAHCTTVTLICWSQHLLRSDDLQAHYVRRDSPGGPGAGACNDIHLHSSALCAMLYYIFLMVNPCCALQQRTALDSYVIRGVTHNVNFLRYVRLPRADWNLKPAATARLLDCSALCATTRASSRVTSARTSSRKSTLRASRVAKPPPRTSRPCCLARWLCSRAPLRSRVRSLRMRCTGRSPNPSPCSFADGQTRLFRCRRVPEAEGDVVVLGWQCLNRFCVVQMSKLVVVIGKEEFNVSVSLDEASGKYFVSFHTSDAVVCLLSCEPEADRHRQLGRQAWLLSFAACALRPPVLSSVLLLCAVTQTAAQRRSRSPARTARETTSWKRSVLASRACLLAGFLLILISMLVRQRRAAHAASDQGCDCLSVLCLL